MKRAEEIDKAIRYFSGTLPDNATLVAVSKTFPPEFVRLAYQAGQRDFGENKVQELLEKSQALQDLEGIRWHFIGHLQSNKVNKLLNVPNLYMVHSIDREKIASKLNHRLAEKSADLKVLIQVNTSREPSKYGCKPDQVEALARCIANLPHLQLAGLMTIGKLGGTEQEAGQCFKELKAIAAQMRKQSGSPNAGSVGGIQELSMGMTSDYRVAIEQGSTMIRVGRAIFGDRKIPDSEYWPE